MSLFKQNEYYYTVKFLFNRINFFETGYKYLFWIHNFIWKKKNFTEKNFCKNQNFLKNIFSFQKVLLHFNNHSQVTLVLCVKLFVQYFVTIFWKVEKSSLQRKDHSMTKWRSDRPLSSTFRRLSYYFSKTLLFLE